MMRLFALLHLGQVPESVTGAAVKGFDEGGYKAVAVVLLAGIAGIAWLYVKERAANRELVNSMKVDSIGATQTYGKLETTLAMTNQALSVNASSVKDLQNEVRILGDLIRSRGAA